jgi:hypothetical protein
VEEEAMTRDLLVLQLPLLEKVLRTIAVYLFLVLALRLAGKRELAQLNSFDLVVLLLLSNTVQNAIIGPDKSLLGGPTRRGGAAGRQLHLCGLGSSTRRWHGPWRASRPRWSRTAGCWMTTCAAT